MDNLGFYIVAYGIVSYLFGVVVGYQGCKRILHRQPVPIKVSVKDLRPRD